MKKNEINKRINNIDTITGLLIIWMIVVHISILFPHFFKAPKCIVYILSFFMSWFFFKSGMLFKSKSTIEVIKSNVKSLLVPFIKYSVIGYILIWLMYFTKGIINKELTITIDNYKASLTTDYWQLIYNGALSYNAPLWFLLSLFLTKVIYIYLYNKKINNYSIISCALLCSSIIYLYKLNIPLYFGNTMLGLFFYVCGIVYNKQKNNIDKEYIYAILFIVYICIFVCYPSCVDFRINMPTKGNYFLWIIYSLIACILYLKIFNKITFNILSFIGRNSIYFYVWHWIILIYIKYISQTQ